MAKQLEGFVQRLTALGGGSGESRALYDDSAAGYGHIDGVEISPGMLARAQAKGVHGRLTERSNDMEALKRPGWIVVAEVGG